MRTLPLSICIVRLCAFGLSVEDDLGRWIAGLSLRLPNVSETKHIWPFGDVSLALSDFICSGFAVDSLNSAVLAPSQSSRSVMFILRGASASSCQVLWAVQKGSVNMHGMNGSLFFRIAEVDLDLPLSFDSAAKDGPISVQSACKTSLKMDRLHFTGDMDKVLDTFSGLVQGSLNHLVDWLGCRVLHHALVPVNALIWPWLQRPTAPQPAPATLPSSALSAHLVHWKRDVLMMKAIPNASAGAADLRAIAARLAGGRTFSALRCPRAQNSPLGPTSPCSLASVRLLTSPTSALPDWAPPLSVK